MSSTFINFDVTQDSRSHVQAAGDRIEAIEDCFFVFLHVLVVSEGQAFESSEQPHQVTKNTAGFPTHEFHRIRVLLLRHQTRARGDGIAKLEEAKLSGGVKNDVFGESREMNHDLRTSTRKLHTEIAITHRIKAVARDRVETQIARQSFAIQSYRSAGEGSRPKRHHVYTTTSVRQ